MKGDGDDSCDHNDCPTEDASDDEADRFHLGDIMTVLTHPVRRRTLLALNDADGELTLNELAAAVEQSNAISDAGRGPVNPPDRVELRLYHVHLPKLADESLVTFDKRDLTAAITANGEEAIRRLF